MAKDGHLVFVGDDGRDHSTGVIIFKYNTGYMEPPDGEQILYFHELEAILDYVHSQFGNGWLIENGKLVGLKEKQND